MNHFRHLYRIDIAGDSHSVIDDQYFSDYQTSEQEAIQELSQFEGSRTGYSVVEEYLDGKQVTRTYLSTMCIRNAAISIEDWSEKIKDFFEDEKEAQIDSNHHNKHYPPFLTSDLGI